MHIATRSLLGVALVFKSSSTDLFTQYSLTHANAHFLTFKSHDATTPYSSLSITLGLPAKEVLTSYMRANALPILGELTESTSNSYLKNPANPLLVFMAVQPDMQVKSVPQIRAVAEAWASSISRRQKLGREVVFAWVCLSFLHRPNRADVCCQINADTWSSWLKSLYSYKYSSEPTVLIADHKVSAILVHLIFFELLAIAEAVVLGDRCNGRSFATRSQSAI